MTDDTPHSRSKKQTDFLASSLVMPLRFSVDTQWSATPIDAPLAPSQVPSGTTTQQLKPMAPGRLEPNTSTLSFLK